MNKYLINVLFFKAGAAPIFENLSVIVCNRCRSFSISMVYSLLVPFIFNNSSQASKEDRGVPNWCAVSFAIPNTPDSVPLFLTYWNARYDTNKNKAITASWNRDNNAGESTTRNPCRMYCLKFCAILIFDRLMLFPAWWGTCLFRKAVSNARRNQGYGKKLPWNFSSAQMTGIVLLLNNTRQKINVCIHLRNISKPLVASAHSSIFVLFVGQFVHQFIGVPKWSSPDQ